MNFKSTKVIFLLALATSLTACGDKNQWIDQAKLRTFVQDQQRFGELTVSINSGDTVMAAADFPIVDPNNPNQILGRVTLKNSLDGKKSEVLANVNIDKVLGLPASTNDPHLPNGTVIPVTGMNPETLQTYNIGSENSKVYINLDTANNTAMLGLALTIKELKTDTFANIFQPFQIDQVRGLSGLYTGPNAGQNGFAIFLDAGAFLANSEAHSGLQKQSAVEFVSQQPAQPELEKIQKELLRLHSSKSVLTVY